MLQGGRRGHGSCEIDENRMIILGGWDDDYNVLSSGFIYDARTEQSTPLPYDMPSDRYGFSAVSNENNVYIIGGRDDDQEAFNTVFCLSLETLVWATLARVISSEQRIGSMILLF